MQQPIPVNTPLFCGNERKYLNECLDTGWISSEGPFVTKFEADFSAYAGRQYGIAVSSGSAALDIAVKALGISAGDEVIVPTFTIISPVLSILNCGAVPVFADSDAETWNVDVSSLEKLITPKTKALLMVHTYGLPVDMEAVAGLARRYGLAVIEDAAEMHGQTCHGKPCGSFGDISIFSFYPNKHITTGEGGMLVCDDPELAMRCSKLRNLSFEPDKPRFVHYETGWNYRMTNLQAALGVAQLEQIGTFLGKKRQIGSRYQEALGFLGRYGYTLPLPATAFASNIYWVFGIVAPEEKEKEKLLQYLTENGIGHRPFFWCMHEQPVFREKDFARNQHHPVAEHLARCGFYIPSGLGLSEDQQEIVCKTIAGFYA
jgi:perosamine synthetase